MKKNVFKFLSMLLVLTLVLSNINCVRVRAEEFQILEIPDFKNASDSIYPGSFGIEGEYSENFKIVIDQYSYCKFNTDSYDYVSLYLYTDEAMRNKILEFESNESAQIFLPKGEYYLNLICNDKTPEDERNTFSFTFGKMSVNEFMKGKIEKKKNKFYYDSPDCFSGGFEGVFIGLSSDDGSLLYDTECTIKCFSSKKDKQIKDNYFKNISFKIYLKNKNSSIKITPTGKTKEILDLEAKGGTYDISNYEEEIKNDSKKKDKKKPTVKGVKNGKTYKKAVKIKVSDASGIKKVTLNGKKMKISKFEKGYKISRKKTTQKYTLKVWDKAGNTKKVKFTIKKK